MTAATNILVIGPTRTASTALWQGLKQIEGVSIASTKENYFFGRAISAKPERTYRDYLSKHFEPGIRVDFEPSLFHHDEQLKKAFATPEINHFVGILRAPIDLYKSAYGYNLRNGASYDGFEAFFQQASAHYAYRRVTRVAQECGVSIHWLPHHSLVADLRVFLTAVAIPFDNTAPLPLPYLNSSTKQVSVIGRMAKRVRALKSNAAIRALAERMRGNPFYERLFYGAAKSALAIPESELATVMTLLEQDEAFYRSLVTTTERHDAGQRANMTSDSSS